MRKRVLFDLQRGFYTKGTLSTGDRSVKRNTGKLGEVKVDGEILCPFFLEGGRVTIDNVHYVKEGNILIPAGMTEFAKDQSFGYQSSDLTEYVEEKTNGRYKKEDCITISLEELRAGDINGITGKLMSAHDFRRLLSMQRLMKNFRYLYRHL